MEVSVNWIAVIVSAVSAFVLGSVWYSPLLFSKRWQIEVELTDDKIKQANMPKIFGTAFVLQFIIAVNLAFFLGSPEIDMQMGLMYGLLTGVWIFCGMATAYMFAQKSWTLIFIDGMYQVVALGLMGLILGAWR
ncbi:DUF1761 domain-containing protein [bacterium]|nr:MAG: DUF1761 domain-containing protein [bacterium]